MTHLSRGCTFVLPSRQAGRCASAWAANWKRGGFDHESPSGEILIRAGEALRGPGTRRPHRAVDRVTAGLRGCHRIRRRQRWPIRDICAVGLAGQRRRSSRGGCPTFGRALRGQRPRHPGATALRRHLEVAPCSPDTASASGRRFRRHTLGQPRRPPGPYAGRGRLRYTNAITPSLDGAGPGVTSCSMRSSASSSPNPSTSPAFTNSRCSCREARNTGLTVYLELVEFALWSA
jgi:hypothetical protein